MKLRGFRPSVGTSRDVAAPALLFAVCVALSLPPLLNAAGTQSDAAVVGLQAMHALHGEHAWFLWGSGYQTSVDVWVATLFFLCFGATPLALMLSTFSGYLALLGFAHATVRRRFEPWSAALLCAPLAVMAPPLHIYAFYPPRQAALTLVFAAVWVLDGVAAREPGTRPRLRLGAGAALAGLACYADPYALLFLPAVALFIALLSGSRQGQGESGRAGRLAAGFGGLALGLVPFWLLSHSSGASHGVYRLSTASLSHNLNLLARDCLPFLLSTKVRRYFPGGGTGFWQPPAWFHAIQVMGAVCFVGALVAGAILAVHPRLGRETRRLGAAFAPVLPLTLGAFLASVMAMDRLSGRYLVAIVLVSPFALGPLLAATSRGSFAALLAPYLVSTAVGGWLGHGDNVDGLRVRNENGEARDERALGEALRGRDIHHGLADYWVSYRLTFLLQEDPVVVPWHATLDRYPPYRRLVENAPSVAYIFDPVWSGEDLEYRKSELRHGKGGFLPDFGELHVGRYTVLILRRQLTREGPAMAGGGT